MKQTDKLKQEVYKQLREGKKEVVVETLGDKVIDISAKAAGAGAAAATPAVVITAGGTATHLAGGAAVMKTLAIAGAVVGGGSISGVAVVAAGSLAIGLTAYKGIKLIFGNRN